MRKGIKIRKKKKEKGITLIALILTIIILLILAGVTISMLSGDNGIITRVGNAKDAIEQSSLKEEVGLAVSSYRINKQTEGIGDLEAELRKIQEASVEEIEEGTYYVERAGYGVTVSEDGEIEEGILDIWDGTTIDKPEVDAQGNWHIYTAAQMKFFAQYCNDELSEEEKATMPEITDSTTVYLENNIDMGARQKDGELTTGVEWTPIGMLEGTFDGKEHSISGIYVKSSTGMAVGLFSMGNIIQNLSIKNSYIESGDYSMFTGGICGKSDKINNCHNINTVVKDSALENNAVGGITGVTFVESNISNCTNSGNIIGKKMAAGGIVGVVGVMGGNNVVENCANFGSIEGTGRVGGIVGNLNQNSEINNCYNTGVINGNENVGGIAGIIFGDVTNSYNAGTINGTNYIGGIVGEIGQGHEANITNCYNEGSIAGTETGIGGILGWASGPNTSGNIEKNYNKGAISGKDKVGGIIGWITSEGFVVTNDYNKGTIAGTSNIGSVVGDGEITNLSNLSNLYYLNTLPIKAINNQDYETQNIKGISEDFNSYEQFIEWLE